MDFREQLKYDGLQRMKRRLQQKAQMTTQTVAIITRTAVEGPKIIEIAGKKILAMPLETMEFTPEQQKKFEEAGGLMNPTLKIANADKHKDKMMYWSESFEALESEIDGILYKDFDLFRKVYEAFPDIQAMTKKEATQAGLYPVIHYRNFAARKWMAKMNAGHLATLDEDCNGELRDILEAAPGTNNLQKLAAMGQAPFGGRNIEDAKVYNLGDWAELGSGSLYDDGNVRALNVHRDNEDSHNYWYQQGFSISGIVILDK